MSLRFEDVIVQKPPASRVYCEHSFVTWSAPLRDSLPSWSACWLLMASSDKPGTTFFGAVVSEQDVVTKEAMIAVAMIRRKLLIATAIIASFVTTSCSDTTAPKKVVPGLSAVAISSQQADQDGSESRIR